MLKYDISQFVRWVGTIRAKINYVSAFCCWQYSQFLMPTFDKRAQWQKKPNNIIKFLDPCKLDCLT